MDNNTAVDSDNDADDRTSNEIKFKSKILLPGNEMHQSLQKDLDHVNVSMKGVTGEERKSYNDFLSNFY